MNGAAGDTRAEQPDDGLDEAGEGGLHDTLGDMLNRLIDGRLAPADEARLDAVLAEDDAALRRYCEWMQLHAALHWEYPAAVMGPLSGDEALSVVSPRAGGAGAVHRPWGVWAAVGLLLLLAGAGMAFFRLGPASSRAKPIAQVASVEGAAVWSGVGGVGSTPLTVGESLAAGCIRLEGATAVVRLRFDDGTEIEVVGDAVVEFEDYGQKKVILRKGSMSFDVRPQPRGRPMVVRTPTAEIEVVGTEFALSASESSTSLGVTEGRVRFKRMVDGSEVDVRANGIATASLKASSPLSVAAPSDLPEAFVAAFAGPRSGPDELGEWQPADGGLPARLRAVPYLAGRTDAGAAVIHHGIAIIAERPGFAAFRPDSVVRLRVRAATWPAHVACMLCMWTPSGAFGGNFLASVDLQAPEAASGDGDPWRTVELPAAAFRPICRGFDTVPAGARVSRIFVNSTSHDVELEVAEIAVERPEVRP
jgi:ferric-dicitrate binding protein FerR (iron transport regulator)